MFGKFSKPVLAAVAVATAASAMPAIASAQSYGSQAYVQGYGGATYGQSQYDYGAQRYYDPCDRERSGRTGAGAGAVIGAGAGAVVGSQLAARGRRTEGSILGGVLGAVIGGSVGRGSSDRCYQNQGYGQPAYGDARGYQGYGQPSYSSSSQAYYDQDGYGSYASAPSYGSSNSYGSSYSSSYGSYNQGYTDGRQDSRRDRRDGYDRRDDRRDEVQYSADGRYWYDPQYGWRPR